ncbi:MAG: heavy metal-binding domain-containing protein [Hyphomicrobiaceae bacterium]|nr:heavy metal-binding domain-containing protein [Hyphomicrobiaceae bacterium]
MVSTETINGEAITHGELFFFCAVSGANVLRDMREAITNTLGGKMTRYEALLDRTIDRALDQLSERARSKGYDAVIAVRVSHPEIVQGAIEVVVTGTGVWLKRPGTYAGAEQ